MASVQKRGYDRDTKKYKYTVIISCGFNPVTGKRIRKCLGTIEAKNKNDAKKKANTLESQYNQGLAIDKNEITLAQYLREYLTINPSEVANTTLNNYKIYANAYIIPKLGTYKMQFLAANPRYIELFKKELLKNGKIKGEGGLSEKSVRYALIILNKAFKYAANVEKIIAENPIKNIALPKISKIKKRATFTELKSEDIENLYYNANNIFGFYMYALLHTDLHTGLARGELLALLWSNVDLDAGKLTISRVLVQDRDENGKYRYRFVNRAKTENRIRTIGITPQATSVLQKLQKEQKKNKLKLGSIYNDQNLVFCNEDGSLLTFGQLRHRYDKIKKAAGIKITFHALRHNVATKLLEEGTSPWEIGKFLGHIDSRQVETTYGHYTEKIDKSLINKMQQVHRT